MSLDEFIAKSVYAAMIGGPFVLILVGSWLMIAYDTKRSVHHIGMAVTATGISLAVCLVLMR